MNALPIGRRNPSTNQRTALAGACIPQVDPVTATAFNYGGMRPEERPGQGAFDTPRALEELERLHDQIVEAREARGRVAAEFDAFVKGFRSQPQPHQRAEALAAAASPEPRADVRQSDTNAEAADTARAAAPAAAAARPTPEPGVNIRAAVVITITVLVVLGAAVFAVRARRSTSITPEAVRPAAVATTPRQPVPAAPATAARPAPAQPGVNLQLITRRRVWVRVTIDGRRAIERELGADQRIPLHADRSILIRAGDAGAVRVTRDGRDAGPLGADGTVATREFTAGPPVR
jgi:uncharacterized protein DUF4115